MSSRQSTELSNLKGIGPRSIERLSQLGISSISDLLFHLPLRYQNRTAITRIDTLREGYEVVIEGQVLAANIAFGRRRSLLCSISDGSGTLGIRFFHFNASQQRNLEVGSWVTCFGGVRRGSSGMEMFHPEYRIFKKDNGNPLPRNLTPVYPTTEGLSQSKLRQWIQIALSRMSENPDLEFLLSVGISAKQPETLPDLLHLLHLPNVDELGLTEITQLQEGSHPAQVQLAFEEIVAHHLSLLSARAKIKAGLAPIIHAEQRQIQKFLASLPFDLTSAQHRVHEEIISDLQQASPMLRLVQGDVGSGKTVIAALAAIHTVAAGFQVALMAPTEILAEQHLLNFRQWMAPLNIEVAWLTGKLSAKLRREEESRVFSGAASIVIGTHALFQKSVVFSKLGLVIIDEQHRFGVHQRLALRNKGAQGKTSPHQLIMTATPIPRTLAMCAYADLDNSVIDELPPGRTPVETIVIAANRRGEVIERVQVACAEGAQAYWVCTLIEDSDSLEAQAAESTVEMLQASLPNLSIALIHGRLKPPVKAQIMADFKAGKFDLLVATTVIEVGVDVANASLMIIENPERLGLAQLHQLRGRVGRGSRASYCVLMYRSPLSQLGKKRLTILRDTNDGFVIAEKDLHLRGPGEVLGTRQTGIMSFKVANFERDSGCFTQAREAAEQLIMSDSTAVKLLVDRWIGQAQYFSQV